MTKSENQALFQKGIDSKISTFFFYKVRGNKFTENRVKTNM